MSAAAISRVRPTPRRPRMAVGKRRVIFRHLVVDAPAIRPHPTTATRYSVFIFDCSPLVLDLARTVDRLCTLSGKPRGSRRPTDGSAGKVAQDDDRQYRAYCTSFSSDYSLNIPMLRTMSVTSSITDELQIRDDPRKRRRGEHPALSFEERRMILEAASMRRTAGSHPLRRHRNVYH